MRRGTTGTSPQHRIKSSIRYMDNLRIFDDRALKVAEFTPGGPLHLGYLSYEFAGEGITGLPNPWHRRKIVP